MSPLDDGVSLEAVELPWCFDDIVHPVFGGCAGDYGDGSALCLAGLDLHVSLNSLHSSPVASLKSWRSSLNSAASSLSMNGIRPHLQLMSKLGTSLSPGP